eukprot:2548037-Amphidinium_carterae.1
MPQQPKSSPMNDQRAKLKVQIKRLATAVDKQQEILTAASAKMQDLRKELATAHVDLAHLPEEILPVPKKIPASVLRTSMVDLMKFVPGRTGASSPNGVAC